MSRPILNAAETRAAEEAAMRAGTSVQELMERAGAGVAEAAWRYGAGGDVLILCGPGNNGGDGYVAARLLAARGAPVRVAASGEPRTEAARVARAGWSGPVETLAEARPAAVLVDALFGTGLARELSGDVKDALHRLAGAARFRLAVDVPSGVETDSGRDLGAARMDLTLALGCLKPAHRLYPAAGLCGHVRVHEIGLAGLPQRLTEIARPRLPGPAAGDHKYRRGYVAVIGGAMPGAALLAATAAQRAGAGYVALFGDGLEGPPHSLVRRPFTADALADRRIGAVVVGPGLGPDLRDRVEAAIHSERPLVMDADALRPEHLAGLNHGRMPVLTPHEGEFDRLFGAIPGSKVERVRAAAESSGAVVLLKGPDTVVAEPGGRAAIGAGASPWLATAGTGDVLAGAIGAMLARGLPPFEAACAGQWLHGEAARLAGPGLNADDLAEALKGAAALA